MNEQNRRIERLDEEKEREREDLVPGNAPVSVPYNREPRTCLFYSVCGESLSCHNEESMGL